MTGRAVLVTSLLKRGIADGRFRLTLRGRAGLIFAQTVDRKEKTMDDSTIILLINDNCRAVLGQYEDGGKKTTFKTLDPSVQVDDLVVVESSTRHEMTVVKIVEVDLDINFDTESDVKWVVQKVDNDLHKDIKRKEREAISAVHSAERRRKRDKLRDSMFADHQEEIKALELASIGSDDEPVVQPGMPDSPPEPGTD